MGDEDTCVIVLLRLEGPHYSLKYSTLQFSTPLYMPPGQKAIKSTKRNLCLFYFIFLIKIRMFLPSLEL